MNQPMKQARLGRGLSALLGDYAGARNAIEGGEAGMAASMLRPRKISIRRTSRSTASFRIPKQPRRTFVEADLEELAESIRAKGVIQPILVRPDPNQPEMFEIIAGERRWRAARRAGLTAMPAVVRAFDDREVLEIAIIENVQRSDLNAVEEAEAYKSLIDRFGRTQESWRNRSARAASMSRTRCACCSFPKTCASMCARVA